MTLDEALAALSSSVARDGNWKEFRERQHAATEFFATFRGEPLRAALPQILRLLGSSNDIHIQAALAVPVARATLELDERTDFVERVAKTPYANPFTGALTELAKRGTGVWPLVRELVASPDVSADNKQRVLSEHFERSHDSAEQFDAALALSPATALRSASGTSWSMKPFEAFVPSIERVVKESTDDALRIEAVRRLKSQKSIDPQQLARVEPVLAGASEPLSAALAAFFVTAGVKLRRSRTSSELRFLADARADVRRAAFEAFISRTEVPRGALPVVIDAWSDSDPLIRKTAERVLREFTAREALGPEELAPLLALLEKGRDDASSFLAWASAQHPTVRDWCLQQLEPGSKLFALLSEKYTLVCVACRDLGRGASWSLDYHAPKALPALESVATLERENWESLRLMRCKTCFAHFTLYEFSETDVNSRRDEWSLNRIRLKELGARYGKHVDLSDPHFAHWEEAAQSDLRHVDPEVRALAKWELEDAQGSR